jgi:hypothetical protein
MLHSLALLALAMAFPLLALSCYAIWVAWLPTMGADPANACASRRNEVVADLAVSALVRALNQQPLGLVLSGGGGKGAYEVGVLLALYDCGIKSFSSIAGTSVGGLNAALAHEMWRVDNPGGRQFAVDLWANIGTRSVLGPSGGLVLKPVLYILAAASQSPSRVLAIISRNLEIDHELYWQRDLLATIALASLCAVVAMAVAGLVTMLVYLPLLSHFVGWNAPRTLGLWLILLVAIASASGKLGRKLAFFSNAPLAALIARLDETKLGDNVPPVTCTLATRLTQPIVDVKGSLWWRPKYITLRADDKAKPNAEEVLLQTAAIPEVFPGKAFNGTRYVDGGIADNIPILGLAESAPDHIIVIYLDHRFRRVKDLARWQTDRLLKLQKSRAGYEQGDEARIDWARRVLPTAISFIPSQNVGNVLTGTLNFNPHKARWLMHLGYGDALDTLQKIAPEKAAGRVRSGS